MALEHIIRIKHTFDEGYEEMDLVVKSDYPEVRETYLRDGDVVKRYWERDETFAYVAEVERDSDYVYLWSTRFEHGEASDLIAALKCLMVNIVWDYE